MDAKEILNIVCAVISAIFAGASFTFYKKTVNIYGNNITNKKGYKNIKQESGNNGLNIVGDDNKL